MAPRARGHAQSARVSGGDGATGRATSVPWVSGHTKSLSPMRAHMPSGVHASGRRDRFSAAVDGNCGCTICGGIGGGVIDEHHMKIIVFLHDYGLDVVDVPIILGVVVAWHHDTEGQLFVFTNFILLFVVFSLLLS